MTDVINPVKLDDITVKKIEEALAMDCTIEEVCLMANISKQTYYNWRDSFPELAERFDQLKASPFLKARKTIIENLGDKETAKWFAERRIKEFKPKNDLTSNDETLPLLVRILNKEDEPTNQAINNGDTE